MQDKDQPLTPLSLRRSLKRLGSHQLTLLVGKNRLDAIQEVFQAPVTESRLVSMLQEKFGTQLLGHREIRAKLIASLPERYLAYVARGSAEAALETGDWEELATLRWDRRSGRVHRLIQIFGLGDDALPEAPEHIPDLKSVNPSYHLFPYQMRVKDELVRLLTRHSRVLVHMPTGAGKTRTCGEAIVDYVRVLRSKGQFVLWLAHSEELCEQAFQTLSSSWESRGDRPLEFHRLWGAHGTPILAEEGGVIICSLQKLHSMRVTQNDETFRLAASLSSRVGLIVVDEAHKTIAPTYQAAIEFTAASSDTRIVGLTATPGRGSDPGENQKLAEFYEERRIGLTGDQGEWVEDPISYLQEREFLARLERKRLRTNFKLRLSAAELEHVSTFLDLPPSVLQQLADDPARNALLTAEIARLAESRQAVLVFALSVEHAHLITDLLNIRGTTTAIVDGSTPTADRRRRIEAYRDGELSVLVNYGVLTTGFDAPITDTVVISRPTASLVLYSQMIGRGIRGPHFGGPDETLLVDLEDNLEGFPSESYAFNYFDHLWSANNV